MVALVNEVGFEPVDNGPLEEGRAQQPGSSVYTADLPADELCRRLAA